MNEIYKSVKQFKKRYPGTVAWRLKAHSKVIARHLNPDEEIKYVFTAQKNLKSYSIFSTYIIVLTNKRILLAQKRLLFGYLFLAITPDMFNDLTVKSGIVWGKVIIDTVKELIILSNISKSALPEIETVITDYMVEQKKRFIKIPKPERASCK